MVVKDGTQLEQMGSAITLGGISLGLKLAKMIKNGCLLFKLGPHKEVFSRVVD